jgi:hypothetical protein
MHRLGLVTFFNRGPQRPRKLLSASEATVGHADEEAQVNLPLSERDLNSRYCRPAFLLVF